MLSSVAELVIHGMTIEGELFEQSDWANNLCGMLASGGADGRVLYSDFVRPVMIQGVSCVVVRMSLEQKEPHLFAMIKQYVAEHRLKVRSGRGSRGADTKAPHPKLPAERRESERSSWK